MLLLLLQSFEKWFSVNEAERCAAQVAGEIRRRGYDLGADAPLAKLPHQGGEVAITGEQNKEIRPEAEAEGEALNHEPRIVTLLETIATSL
jgi:hypothetical protein